MEAFNAGINFFDTSPFYGDTKSETVGVGAAGLRQQHWGQSGRAVVGSVFAAGRGGSNRCIWPGAATRTAAVGLMGNVSAVDGSAHAGAAYWTTLLRCAAVAAPNWPRGQLKPTRARRRLQVLGRGLAKLPRDQIIVATKVGWWGAGAAICSGL